MFFNIPIVIFGCFEICPQHHGRCGVSMMNFSDISGERNTSSRGDLDGFVLFRRLPCSIQIKLPNPTAAGDILRLTALVCPINAA